MGACSVCEQANYSLGFCRKHYEKYRKYGDPFFEIKIQGDGKHRIEKRIELVPFTTCWIWMGSVNGGNGYGCLAVGAKNKLAHRYSYEVFKGPIPAGLHVMHKCHNRLCVNPDHLEAGTPTENEKQKKIAGRTAVGERNGFSKLSNSQAYSIKRDGRLLRQIATDYGVSETTVSRIRRGVRWSSVT